MLWIWLFNLFVWWSSWWLRLWRFLPVLSTALLLGVVMQWVASAISTSRFLSLIEVLAWADITVINAWWRLISYTRTRSKFIDSTLITLSSRRLISTDALRSILSSRVISLLLLLLLLITLFLINLWNCVVLWIAVLLG